MWRACHAALRPGGRMAGYLIHTPTGLSAAEVRRAAELGPSAVHDRLAPADLARRSRFDIVLVEDVTDAFADTCTAILTARDELEVELRAEEGSVVFEHERERKVQMLAGIRAGLLKRSLVVARRA